MVNCTGEQSLVVLHAIIPRPLGVSRARIAWSVVKTGLLVMVAVMGLQEFVAPKLDQLAFERRTHAIAGMESTGNRRGFWSRNGQRVVHVGHLLHGRIPTEIEIYQFDDSGSLRFVAWAKEAVIKDSKRWELHDVRQQIISENKTSTNHFAVVLLTLEDGRGGNWSWRCTEEMMSPADFDSLRELTKRSNLLGTLGRTEIEGPL